MTQGNLNASIKIQNFPKHVLEVVQISGQYFYTSKQNAMVQHYFDRLLRQKLREV